MYRLILFLLLPFSLFSQDLTTVFERSAARQTPTYYEAIDWWKKADKQSSLVTMLERGPTDAGFPLHLILVRAANYSKTAANGITILVNNGIHPGEPDGIDASMLLVKDIIQKKVTLPSNITLAIIPVYNIGGALNRSSNYRVDQNGPEEFGFRGNSQNLDLNRDFIKADSKEALSFARIFTELDPDIFIDNHVSNGADYQHVMTLLSTQHNKLGYAAGSYLKNTMEPAIYSAMNEKGWDLLPYVNHYGQTPEKGWPQYWDGPRYSSGYAALFSTFAFVPETHMLKPYDQRVRATYDLMLSFIRFATANASSIKSARRSSITTIQNSDSLPVAWKHDTKAFSNITYKGYEAGYKTSTVTGAQRLFYDRNKPFNRTIPFYDTYNVSLTVAVPEAYIIPQGWHRVIERLSASGIQMQRLKRDTSIHVQWHRINNYTSSPRPYEGHHINTNVQTSLNTSVVQFRKGDYYIRTAQRGRRLLVETLEPTGDDSYFTWNFFDPILGQKEGISDYVFEETAQAILDTSERIRMLYQNRLKDDTSFAKNARAQLNFIYQQSPFYEPAHLRHPVFKIRSSRRETGHRNLLYPPN